MIKLIFNSSLLCIILVGSASAQRDFSGFISLTNGDTLSGTMYFKKYSNSYPLLYITRPDGQSLSFRPGQVKEIRQNNERRKFIGSDSIFLEALVQGKSSLFYFRDKKRSDHFYILKVDSTMEELQIKTIQLEESKSKVIDLYKGQLNSHFSSCPELYPKISKVSYNEPKLLKIFVEGYTCIYSSRPDFIKSIKKRSPDFGFFGGIVLSKLTFRLVPNAYFFPGAVSKYKFDPSFSPSFGVVANLSLSEKKNIYWSNELAYKQLKTSSQFVKETSVVDLMAKINYSYLRYTMGLKYLVNLQTIKPIFYLGGSINYLLSDKSSIIKRLYNGVTTTETELEPYQYTNFEYGYLAGLGLNFKQFDFGYRYEQTFSALDLERIKLKNVSQYVSVWYTMKTKKASK